MWPSPSLLLCAPAAPARWQRAARMITPAKILPVSLGGERDQEYAAWKGDKILGAAAIKALEQSDDAHIIQQQQQQQQHSRVGSATTLVGTALSNSFLAANVSIILPEYEEEAKLLSEHQVGTMLEAAVADIQGTDEAAVVDLAAWLIETAAARPDPNAKGSLLRHGGSVEADRVGGLDHAASFTATAKFEEHTAVATAASKKKAEQLAAGRLLEKLQIDTSWDKFEDRKTVSLDRTFGEWDRDTWGANQQLELHLQGGESTEEWWLRGAWKPKESFWRAIMSPLVFPERIAAVDSWIRASPHDNSNELSAGFTIISYFKSEEPANVQKMAYHITPVYEATSNTQARIKLGMEANRIIEGIARKTP